MRTQLFSVFAVSLISLASFQSSASSNCNVQNLKKDLQALVPQGGYAPQRVANLRFLQAIAPRSSSMLVAGADDITYINGRDVAVEAFELVTTDLVGKKFYAAIVDNETCETVDLVLVDDVAE